MSEDKNIPPKKNPIAIGSEDQGQPFDPLVTGSAQDIPEPLSETNLQKFPEDKRAPAIKEPTIKAKQETENMEVHHHGHIHEKKKWKEYLFQFLMLFLAVFCGFLAEYQLEHKIEKDRERQFISSLVADLYEDTVSLANAIRSHDYNVGRMDTLIQLLNSPGIKNFSSDLYYLGRRASRTHQLAINDRTIQQMKNSGGFRLIRKEKASTAIIDYYSQLTFIEMMQSIDINEQNEYRRIAIDIFHPLVFDSIVLPDNSVKRPSGNPPLLSYDSKLLLRLAGMVSYMKNSRSSLADAERDLKLSAKNLITLLKKEYRLK